MNRENPEVENEERYYEVKNYEKNKVREMRDIE